MKRCAALALAMALAIEPATADPVELATFRDLPRPEPTLHDAYDGAPAQGVDGFLPEGPGPQPVAVLIHGGCWSATTAGREQMRHLGQELTRRGIAVWSIGYRRADEAMAALSARHGFARRGPLATGGARAALQGSQSLKRSASTSNAKAGAGWRRLG